MKEYSLIKNNIILEMFCTDNIEKIKKQTEYSEDCQIVEKESWHFKGLNILRYQNGKLLSNKEAIKQGIIKLKENEHLFDSDVILEIQPTQKVLNNEIVDKTMLEKYNDGLINSTEYNEYIRKERENEYVRKTDELKQELIENVLITLKEKNILTEEQIGQLDLLINEKTRIKNTYQKVKENKKVK